MEIFKRHPDASRKEFLGGAKVVWDFYPVKHHGHHEMYNNLHVNIAIIKTDWIKRSDTYFLIFDTDPSCQGSLKSISAVLHFAVENELFNNVGINVFPNACTRMFIRLF